MEFLKYSSIEQFKSVIKHVNDYCKHNNKPLPTLTFNGTVKLHGTNAGVAYDVASNEFSYQSRERQLTLTSDNNGFMLWASQDINTQIFNNIISDVSPKESIYIFGEWCGGNIQKNVALNNLPKMFVIFSIVVDGVKEDISKFKQSPDSFKQNSIYHVYDFPSYSIDIDFNSPQVSQNTLVDLTIAVEDECPVGKTLLSHRDDYAELNKIGEGAVWYNHEHDLIFKTKGEKHSVSKVKTIKNIAAIDIEKMENLKEFIDTVCTPNRLEQGLQSLQEAQLDITDNKNIGAFIKWMATDIFKEESDIIVENQFDSKMVGSEIAKVSRNYYMGKL